MPLIISYYPESGSWKPRIAVEGWNFSCWVMRSAADVTGFCIPLYWRMWSVILGDKGGDTGGGALVIGERRVCYG